MDYYGTDADARHENDILEDSIFLLVAYHRAATVFYDGYLSAEFLYIRQRLYEGSCLFYRPLKCVHVAFLITAYRGQMS